MSGALQAVFQNQRSFGPSVIGESFGGGYYFGKIVQGGVSYFLIMSPKSSGQSTSKQWKTTATAGPAATITLNNGPAASSSMNSATYPAAEFCEGLSIGGYTDWYLPSRDEFELIYRNLKPTTNANNLLTRTISAFTYPEGNDVSGDTMGRNRNSSPTGAAYVLGNPAQTSLALFQQAGAESITAARHWTSSDLSTTDAWTQACGTGDQALSGLKTDNYYVRAIRRVAA